MDLIKFDNSIETWFFERENREFPDSQDYISLYKTIKSKLEAIHPDVSRGADITDETTLTKHDISHINKVIENISKLLSYKHANINAYEAYHLLIAVQIHDIANIEGRSNHENRAVEIFQELGIPDLIDSRTKKMIETIVSCHSGTFLRFEEEESDKIGYLLEAYDGSGKFKIRPQFLAALLRLSDEFADDNTRSMEYLIRINKIPKKSEIHQKYANCLRPIVIEENSGTVEYEYWLKNSDIQTKIPHYKQEDGSYNEMYLLDYIFRRLEKAHYETIYCMRFLRPSISINKLKVTIDNEMREQNDPSTKFSLELIEKGYPRIDINIYDICGESLKINGDRWNGEKLKEFLNN